MSSILVGVTEAEINSNYLLRQVQLLKTNDSDLVSFDPVPDNLSVPASQITITGDPAPVDTVALGTELTVNLSNQVILIGHGSTVQDSNDCISIGGSSQAQPTLIRNANSSINIGHDNPMGGAGNNQADFNIVIGSTNPKGVAGVATQNIIIGNAVNSGDQKSNQIILAHKTLAGEPASGAIVFGGGGAIQPAGDARVQFLSDDIIELTNNAKNAVYNPADGAANQATNGWLRLRYKGQNIRIPIINDDEVAVP